MSVARSEPDHQTSSTRWSVTWELVKELWPSWDPTDVQSRMWERRLAGRYQIAVREALEQVAAERPYLTPRLGWVLDILKGKSPQQDTSGRYDFADEEIAGVVGDDQDIVDDLLELPEGYLRELLVEGLVACLVLEVGLLVSDMPRIRIDSEQSAREFDLDVRRWDPLLRGLVWAAWKKAAG